MTSLTKKVLPHPSISFLALKQLLKLPKGVNLIVISAALYGLTMVVTKGTLAHIPPLTLLTVQTASSVAFFWSVVFLQGIQIPLQWNTLKIGLAGLLEPGMSYLFAMLGLSLTTANNSTFISTTEPVITVALSWFILREPISRGLMGLGFVACIGVAIVAAVPDPISFGQGGLWGDALILLSALFASLYAITTSRSVGSLAPVAVAAIQQSVSLILYLGIAIAAVTLNWEVIEFTATTWKSLLVAVLSGAFGYGLAFLLYVAAMRYQPASKISLYLTLIPIFGAIAAYFFLGESFLLSQKFGGTLILLAVIGISRLPQHTCKN
jgi:drug/metabolite transporter (DMT)-like permease